ncbi:MAG: uncharacterized protein KVP18_002795 [Porospora cf. gigantea A]|uniref:uncharacterized protein n=1 Tax=Porospora cf. gigantea A TaxID=2853593 RepID=UPI003559A1A3|nr:MAG: hypothetical protein KVP18_002795 [Porospora cf. gigantea A]
MTGLEALQARLTTACPRNASNAWEDLFGVGLHAGTSGFNPRAEFIERLVSALERRDWRIVVSEEELSFHARCDLMDNQLGEVQTDIEKIQNEIASSEAELALYEHSRLQYNQKLWAHNLRQMQHICMLRTKNVLLQQIQQVTDELNALQDPESDYKRGVRLLSGHSDILTSQIKALGDLSAGQLQKLKGVEAKRNSSIEDLKRGVEQRERSLQEATKQIHLMEVLTGLSPPPEYDARSQAAQAIQQGVKRWLRRGSRANPKVADRKRGPKELLRKRVSQL